MPGLFQVVSAHFPAWEQNREPEQICSADWTKARLHPTFLGEQGIYSLFEASAAGRKLPSEVNFFSAVRNLLQLGRSRDILGNAVICPVRPQSSRLK
jgi:hypothetical protein